MIKFADLFRGLRRKLTDGAIVSDNKGGDLAAPEVNDDKFDGFFRELRRRLTEEVSVSGSEEGDLAALGLNNAVVRTLRVELK